MLECFTCAIQFLIVLTFSILFILVIIVILIGVILIIFLLNHRLIRLKTYNSQGSTTIQEKSASLRNLEPRSSCHSEVPPIRDHNVKSTPCYINKLCHWCNTANNKRQVMPTRILANCHQSLKPIRQKKKEKIASTIAPKCWHGDPKLTIACFPRSKNHTSASKKQRNNHWDTNEIELLSFHE